jgi:hypothetical protein
MYSSAPAAMVMRPRLRPKTIWVSVLMFICPAVSLKMLGKVRRPPPPGPGLTLMVPVLVSVANDVDPPA